MAYGPLFIVVKRSPPRHMSVSLSYFWRVVVGWTTVPQEGRSLSDTSLTFNHKKSAKDDAPWEALALTKDTLLRTIIGLGLMFA